MYRVQKANRVNQYAQMILSEAQLDHSVAANLLQVTSSQQVNFILQLLQEYFASLGLKRQIETKQFHADDLWPRQEWWKP